MPIPDAMGASFGASFAPTREAAASARTRPTPSPLQQAVQVLSLRLPQVLQGAPAPAELLTAPRGQGANLASAVVQSVLRTVLGGQRPDGAFPAPAPPQLMAPAQPPGSMALPALPGAGGLPAPRRRPELEALMELLGSTPSFTFAEPVVTPDQGTFVT